MKNISSYIKIIPVVLCAVFIRYIGYMLYVLSALIRTLAYLGLLMPRSAKGELRAMFRVYGSVGDKL